jgi:hypothetical protein
MEKATLVMSVWGFRNKKIRKQKATKVAAIFKEKKTAAPNFDMCVGSESGRLCFFLLFTHRRSGQ